jgi:hypothetical protein
MSDAVADADVWRTGVEQISKRDLAGPKAIRTR